MDGWGVSLEKLVHQIEPTVEFTTTMLAEQYRQSLIGQDYSQSAILDGDLDEDD